MKKILLIEDDPTLALTLKLSLCQKGYELFVCETLEQASTQLSSVDYHLVLLDVNLPDGNGISFCKSLREKNKSLPIILVTAEIDEDSVVQGISSGADDYIRKPFGINELAVRMNRLLDREQKSNLVYGPLKIDLNKRLAFVNSQPLNLGKKEFQILQLLVQRQGDITTREQIIQFMGDNNEIFDRTIDSHLSHLRRKLRDSDLTQIQIVPVYGIGYRLEIKLSLPKENVAKKLENFL